MKVLTREELRLLAENEPSPCVSIYLPTHPRGEEMQEDRIRLETLVDRAEPMLLAQGFRLNEPSSRGSIHTEHYWYQPARKDDDAHLS